VWLFGQNGPGAEDRKKFRDWRRIWGDELVSLWEASP
jgi:hypothetical protein